MNQLAAIAICFVFLLGCSKYSDLVDRSLQGYLDDFKAEALKRGFKVNYETKQIEARLVLHQDNSNLGWCSYNAEVPNMITINDLYWDVLDDFEKEKLIFHELGHCVLNRPHYDVTRLDGRCKSIMHSGQLCSDDYNASNRTAYLDELFFK